jgi:hypothetical protein
MSVSRKHFVRITTWDDIHKMSGYTDSLDPKKEKLKHVINKYELPNKGRCGLSNCRTPHFNGYIVETETGKLTNLGHICGKNHFGLNFTSLKNKLDKEVEYINKVEIIKVAKLGIENKRIEISSIESYWNEIEDVYRTIKIEGLNELHSRLDLMSNSKDPTISIQHNASKSERDLEEVRTGRRVEGKLYISEKIGKLNGLNYIKNRIRIEAMIFNNRLILKDLEKFDENKKSLKNINIMIKENERLEDSIREAHIIIADGFKLFSADNMKQFTPLINSKRHRKLRRFLNCCFET